MFSPTEYKRILTFKSWEINDAYYDQTLINTNLIDYQNDHGTCIYHLDWTTMNVSNNY